MINLSWQFYKGYYKDFPFWNNLDDKKYKERIEQFFAGQNKPFLGSVIQPVSGVTLIEDAPATSGKHIYLYTTYPGLLIGSGYAHGAGAVGEFKIGFYLDYTTGMPVIPGSSVKGALRTVFPQFKLPDKKIKIWAIADFLQQDDIAIAKADYIATQLQLPEKDLGERCRQVHHLELTVFEGLNVAACTDTPVYHSIYRRDIFHDAHPVAENSRNELFGTDSITPHARPGVPYEQAMLENPTPLLFLKVLPNVKYDFRFDLKAPEVLPGINPARKKELFAKLLSTFGVGAKTNVGYGQFSDNPIRK